MIFYTCTPLELVFENYDQFKPHYEEIHHNGVHMVIEQNGMYQGKIVRLLSTDPADYLNPGLAPGAIVDFQPSRPTKEP